MKPIGLSTPWYDYLEVIVLQKLKNAKDETHGPQFSLGRIYLNDFLETSKKCFRDKPNGP